MLEEGAIVGSEIDDPSDWDPLNRIVAHAEGDLGVGIAKQNNYVVAIKQWTTEFFYDNSNPTGSPLARYSAAFLNYGAASGESIAEIDGTLLWVATNRSESPHVVRLDDLKLNIVSTPPIDRILESLGRQDMFAFTVKIAGHRFYVLNIDAQLGFSLVYDLDQNFWYFWNDSDSDATEGYWPFVGVTFSSDGRHVAQHVTDGTLYAIAADYLYPVDYGILTGDGITDGFVPTVDIYTPNMDFSVNRIKTLFALYFNADRQQGTRVLSTSLGQAPGGNFLYSRRSDDDYQHWSSFRTVNLDNKRPFITNEGSFHRRAYHFRHESPEPLRLKTIDMLPSLGTL